VTQQNSALVEENAASAKTLEHQSETMNQKVAFFQLGEQAEGRARKPPVVAAARPRPSAAPPKKEAAPIRKVALAAGSTRGGGPVGRMQAAVASAIAEDSEWKEF
jgi:methyl-accepting chemotaxis protein